MKKRRILATSALPYANGAIHLGHILEYIQTDIWVRFQRLRDHCCHYICADDAHGSAIMLKARSIGISPEHLIERVQKEHLADFKDFAISFDNYYSTHSPENRHYAELIYRRLDQQDYIKKRTIQQAYDEEAGMFLPDRFICGECPRCGAAEQYGDCCEECGATYATSELRSPRSVLSNSTPTQRESKHLFFDLARFTDSLKQWLAGGHIQPEIANKLEEWFTAGLAPWDISRDAPYFGFAIPGYKDKFFYVWLDAPIGYMASFQQYCNRRGFDFYEYWGLDSGAELHHFIGKDIAYFHTLFWPAMLEGSGFRKPTRIHCHGFVTINGQKMSKSRGTFITARDYLERLDAEYLRYYFAARLNARVEDIDLNLEDFVLRVNSDLVGKLINIASRCARFIEQHCAAYLRSDETVLEHPLVGAVVQAMDEIAAAYEALEYSSAMRTIMDLADQVNRYINQEKPWRIVKDNHLGAAGDNGGSQYVHAGEQERARERLPLAAGQGIMSDAGEQQRARERLPLAAGQSIMSDAGEQQRARERLQIVCSVGLVAFAQMVLYLKPVMPALAARVEGFLRVSMEHWGRPSFSKPNHLVKPFTVLLNRIRLADVQALVKLKQAAVASNGGDSGSEADKNGRQQKDDQETKVIGMEDFAKLELRVARIIQAEEVPNADRLLKLNLDFGDQQRLVFAGIKTAYKPQQLRDRLVVAVANLAPKKMSFGVSEAMVLAAGDGKDIFLLAPDSGARPGMKIK